MRRNSLSGNTTVVDECARCGDPPGQLGIGFGVSLGERVRVGLIGHPRPDDLHPHVDITRRVHVNGQAEPVQQLRAQFALFGIHRADQHEPGLVRMRDAVALDVHASHRGGVEEHIDQVVVQQVDLVDVEHAAVRAGQQARRKRVLAVAQHPLQVQRADHPVFGCAERQLDQARVAHVPVAADNNAASPRTAVDFAVPFSPRISAPPISGRTAHSSSASRSWSWPTIALNGIAASRLLRSVGSPASASAHAGCRRRGTPRRRG